MGTQRHHLIEGAQAEPDDEAMQSFLDHADPTRATMRAITDGVEACNSTTQAILSLAQWHAEHNDDAGADLLRTLARDFAAHEIETL